MRLLRLSFTLVILWMGAVQAGTQNPDSLIVHVSRKMASYDHDFDYTCLVRSSEYRMDSRWQPVTTRQIGKRLIKQGDVTWFEVIRAVEFEKGREKDITEKVREEYDRARAHAEEEAAGHEAENGDDGNGEEKHQVSLGMDDINPFQEDRRDLYSFHMLPDTMAQGRRYIRVRTTAVEPSPDVYEGTYRIDPDTYSIDSMALHPSKNPKFVRELALKFRFQDMGGGRWMPVQIKTRVYVNLLIKKIRIETEEVYSEYVFTEK